MQSPTHDESTQTEMQSPTHEKAIQTENVTEDLILEEVLNLSDNEMLYILENIWINVPHNMKLNFTFDFYLSLNSDQQCQFFSLLGNTLNDSIYETSKKHQEKVKGTTFQILSKVSKQSFLETCTQNIKAQLS